MGIRKSIKYFLPIILMAILLISCKESKGEADKTGSWSQINQTIERDEKWQKIVSGSPFKLGERYVKGSWYTGKDDEKEDYYGIEYGTYPSLDGSTVAVPMAMEFARQHLDLSDDDAKDFVFFNTTHQSYENLIYSRPNSGGMIRSTTTFLDENQPVDLIIATEPSQEELTLAKDNNVELLTEPVCYDAFVFITHKENPVDSLSVEEIQKIYSGEITNWKEVGGDNAKIISYQREENSGSQTAMKNLVMKGIPMLPPETTKVSIGMGALIDAVAEYKNSRNSIGYTYKYYIDTLYKNENIKILNIEGISPSPDNMRNSTYPFSTCYYGVIRKSDKDNTGGRFLQWMISEEGQKCIAQAGYITLK
ncbi:phosphate-binding protein PstS 1 precursor [Oxobacter pfennigii]|uniref:Phosphate-binding protein PstS 1 n=1 Tax=Oxobacter pfennigii TaxID=36849 RepID=A0A0P8W631_9CLOT|nr:substrate-binding domain-containing protein [Oxobacter pfennigii]KPU44153.1 phosphate-binding protein PstS 1 precursor [Oxobacter pfennigii]